MKREAAEALDSGVRSIVAGVWDLMRASYVEKSWQPLGYASFEDYARSLPKPQLAIEERRLLAVEYTSEDLGMTQREAAAALGVDQRTVGRDVEAFASPEPEIERDVEAFASPEPEIERDVEAFASPEPEIERDVEAFASPEVIEPEEEARALTPSEVRGPSFERTFRHALRDFRTAYGEFATRKRYAVLFAAIDKALEG